MRVKRFVLEYKNHKTRQLKENQLMRKDVKAQRIEDMEKFVKLLKNGLITTDECMTQIAKI